MYIRRYTIAAFLFVVLLGWYVYAFITQESINIDFFGIPLPSLSIALWIVIPVVALYIASVLHMSFYSMLGSLKLRKYEKDYDKLIDAIVAAYLGKENRNHMFKTPRYQLLGSLVDNTTLFPTKDLASEVSNEKIDTVLDLIKKIKDGDVVELKKFSLPVSNALVVQNERNRYKKVDISCEDILSQPNKYDESLAKEVYVDFVKTAPMYAIEKYKNYLTKNSLYAMLARINASEDTLEASNESLISLFETLELDSKDYMKISNVLSAQMIPEQRMKLFETISEEKEEAMEAYLFTLFDLEMLAPADEILDNSQPDEYMRFKAYRALKECNKHFNINLFL